MRGGSGEMLDAAKARARGFEKLADWMGKAQATWKKHSSGMTLVGRWNYHNELTAQIPIPELRATYAASGSLPAATVLRNQAAIIEHKLYWSAPSSEDEAYYLVAVSALPWELAVLPRGGRRRLSSDRPR
jgi:hypothetical protein